MLNKINIGLTDEILEDIKKHSTQRGMSAEEYVLEAISKQIDRDKKTEKMKAMTEAFKKVKEEGGFSKEFEESTVEFIKDFKKTFKQAFGNNE